MNSVRLGFFCLGAVCAWAQPQVIASGLNGPQKVVLTPRGNLLVTETSLSALAYDPSTRDLIILELSGRVLSLRLD